MIFTLSLFNDLLHEYNTNLSPELDHLFKFLTTRLPALTIQSDMLQWRIDEHQPVISEEEEKDYSKLIPLPVFTKRELYADGYVERDLNREETLLNKQSIRQSVVPSVQSEKSSKDDREPFVFSILDIDNVILVQTLNFIEFDLFGRINARDFLQFVWSKGNMKGTHPQSIRNSISHFNHISNWVCPLSKISGVNC